MSARRLVSVGLGVAYLAVALVLVLITSLFYRQAFTDTVRVELVTGSLGTALREGSGVKANGVRIGRVETVESTDTGALLTLALEPEQAARVPADTTARLLPSTLFGERFVALGTGGVPGSPGASGARGTEASGVRSASGTATPAAGSLSEGDTIHQDTSPAAVEIEELFDDLLPLLTAVEPEKISATLSEIATALRGQGDDLGSTLAATGAYLEKLNPSVPQLTDDLAALGRVAENYAEAVPDLLASFDDLTVTSQTLVDEREALSELYRRVISSADMTTGWVGANRSTIRILASESRAALAAVAPYAPQFPCVLESARSFIPDMDRNLGAGTDNPGLRVEVRVAPTVDRYTTGDRPGNATGPARCPYGPAPSAPSDPAPTDPPADPPTDPDPTDPDPTDPDPTDPGTPPVAGSSGAGRLLAERGLGQANSPEENQMTAELLGPEMGLSPPEFPRWGTLVLGPVLRDAEVVLR